MIYKLPVSTPKITGLYWQIVITNVGRWMKTWAFTTLTQPGCYVECSFDHYNVNVDFFLITSPEINGLYVKFDKATNNAMLELISHKYQHHLCFIDRL